MIEYKKIILENQLEIYTLPVNKKSGVISVDIFYKVGSRNEKMGKSGIAHMLEHLNFKSTKNLKTGEFDEIIKGFGGVDNASTGFDYTHYYIKCSNENLEKSLWLFAELMENLNLKDEEFQPERDVVLEERRWRTDNNPLGYLYFNLYNHAFLHHPYHWTPIGFSNDIQNWTIEDIKDFHQQFYQPKNAILLVSGDISEENVFKLTKKYFSHIKNTKNIPLVFEKEPVQNGAKRVILHKESDVELLALAFKIPPFNHEDMPKLCALSELLGSGKSSLMNEILIDKLSLINEFYAYPSENIDENLFIFICVCNEGIKAIDVEKELWKILNDLKHSKFDDEVMEKIKNNVKSEFIFSLNNATSVANTYGSYLAKGDLKPLLDYEKNINLLTKEDLVQCAKKYFIENTSTTIILKKEDNE